MESFAGRPSLGGQKEGLQGVVGSTPLEKGVEGRVDQAGSRRRHGGVGSRKLVGLEGSDTRLYEEVGDQGRGGWRGKKGHGGACEQFLHSQEEKSLPCRIASCRDFDDAPPRLSEFVARRPGHWLPEEEK